MRKKRKPNKIWTTPIRLSELMGLNRATIYRRIDCKNKDKRLKSRLSLINGNTEFMVPDEYADEYLKRYKTK